MTKEITALGEREILALAISLEEEDPRIYPDLAERERLRLPDPVSALDAMRDEEATHRALYEFYVGPIWGPRSLLAQPGCEGLFEA